MFIARSVRTDLGGCFGLNNLRKVAPIITQEGADRLATGVPLRRLDRTHTHANGGGPHLQIHVTGRIHN